MKNLQETVDSIWGRRPPRLGRGALWTDIPAVQERIASKVVSPGYHRVFDEILRRWDLPQQKFNRCLSLACGFGDRERLLAQQGVFEECIALDLSPSAISAAKELARENGIRNIRFRVADMNCLQIEPKTYDLVYAGSAAHHVFDLEHLYSQVRTGLTERGVFLMDEYVGPPRFQFSRDQKCIINSVLNLLPLHLRAMPPTDSEACSEHSGDGLAAEPTNSCAPRKSQVSIVRRVLAKARDRKLVADLIAKIAAAKAYRRLGGHYKLSVKFPGRNEMLLADPTEAARSDKIITIARDYFSFVEVRPYGGSLLQFLLADIAGNFMTDDPAASEFLKILFHLEDALMEAGVLGSDFAYVIASNSPPRTRSDEIEQAAELHEPHASQGTCQHARC